MSGEWWVVVLVVAGVLVAVTLAVTIKLAVRLVRAKRALTDAGVPVGGKLAFWGALAYVISPVDLMPDPILLDDIGVLLFALHSLHRMAENARTGDAPKLDAATSPTSKSLS
ncbi:DUF1232 domain-containing protein [Streptomyces sp. OF3]|uniref:DUF1232 domain-containing protein n=1 Tax=Streptomyces alkaliterrae TaxID=2213162 RepID=A0A7W3ZPE1_9ACTN|nr:YkvA family protein [Streptomyces alkaliterrae]MBB1255535.1 DUF1232 domain-containing protein [Streptomyces alkaliterrae]